LPARTCKRFTGGLAEQFLTRGWLRLYIARVDGNMVGVEYAFRFRQRYYFQLNGSDPELGRYSLGSLLIRDAVRQAIAEGCTEADFLRGKGAYKAQLGATEDRLNARLLLWRRHSARARAMLWLDDLPSRLTPLIKLKKQLTWVFRPTNPSSALSGATATDHLSHDH
jgi:CelD/BcsL family acetyltransferase involved in cellulose biosynthesis